MVFSLFWFLMCDFRFSIWLCVVFFIRCRYLGSGIFIVVVILVVLVVWLLFCFRWWMVVVVLCV